MNRQRTTHNGQRTNPKGDTSIASAFPPPRLVLAPSEQLARIPARVLSPRRTALKTFNLTRSDWLLQSQLSM
jgi:hypothetical protein